MKNRKTDVCYVISHGFAARMLLQTGLIERLAASGNTIAIVVPDAQDENLNVLRLNENIRIYESKLKLTIWDDDYHFKRKYYLEDIRNNTALWEKHIHSIYYSKSRHPWKRIRPFYYYAVYQLIKLFPAIRERFKAKEDQHLASPEAGALLREINPRLLVATYPVNFLEAKMLYAAKQEKISTLIHLLSWDNITCKGIFPVAADYFIAWGEVMYQELKAYYHLPDEKIFVCGVPHFDHHVEVKRNPDFREPVTTLGLDPDKPYLLFAMSSPRFSPKEIDIVEWLAATIERDELGEDLQLIVRPHPQNVQSSMADKSWLKRLDRLQTSRIAIDYPRLVESRIRWSMKREDMDHLCQLLAGCSICLNSGSTVSIDALQLDKPVVLTAFDGEHPLTYWKSARRLMDYPHQKKFVALGGAKVVSTYQQLKTTIVAYLDNPDLDREQRENALRKECFKNDGRSTERALAAMSAILKRIAEDAPTAHLNGRRSPAAARTPDDEGFGDAVTH